MLPEGILSDMGIFRQSLKRPQALTLKSVALPPAVFVGCEQLRSATNVRRKVATALENAIASGVSQPRALRPRRYSSSVTPRKNPVTMASMTVKTIVVRGDHCRLRYQVGLIPACLSFDVMGTRSHRTSIERA